MLALIDSIFNAPGAETVIACLMPKDGEANGSRVFPRGFGNARVANAESLHDWLQRLAGGPPDFLDLPRFAVTPNFAFFGSLDWDQNTITRCCLQALVIEEATLREFCESSRGRPLYYRLDFDLTCPGKLFTHPHPHIHSNVHDAPRFSFAHKGGEFIVISFLEFIFLNHFHESWMFWAETEAVKRISEHTFASIFFNYESGAIIDNLAELGEPLNELKAALQSAKTRKTRNPLALPPICGVFNY
jgi:hypothetical protein